MKENPRKGDFIYVKAVENGWIIEHNKHGLGPGRPHESVAYSAEEAVHILRALMTGQPVIEPEPEADAVKGPGNMY